MFVNLLRTIRFAAILLLLFITACSRAVTTPHSTPKQHSQNIIVSGWAGYMPTGVLDQFEKEFGVHVEYHTYDDQEQVVNEILAGQVYDIVVLDGNLLRKLIESDSLAPLNYQKIPNFKYISANFRDLSYDPGNRYSIMLQWGITAMLVREDLATTTITSWADFWDETYRGKIGIWPYQRPVIGITLKALGYSVNTENPEELSKAREHLMDLKERAILIDYQMPNVVPLLSEGKLTLAYGWAFDILDGREQHSKIGYVLPKEGPLVWGDNVVIPANSPNKETAELFINFLFRPEISAQITNEIYVATPNEAANQYINREILNDQAIFPPNDALRNAEMILSLSPAAQKIYDEMWQEFIGDVQQ